MDRRLVKRRQAMRERNLPRNSQPTHRDDDPGELRVYASWRRKCSRHAIGSCLERNHALRIARTCFGALPGACSEGSGRSEWAGPEASGGTGQRCRSAAAVAAGVWPGRSTSNQAWVSVRTVSMRSSYKASAFVTSYRFTVLLWTRSLLMPVRYVAMWSARKCAASASSSSHNSLSWKRLGVDRSRE